jgi:hypothetical protein
MEEIWEVNPALVVATGFHKLEAPAPTHLPKSAFIKELTRAILP